VDDHTHRNEVVNLRLPDLSEQVDFSSKVLLMGIEPEEGKRTVRVNG